MITSRMCSVRFSLSSRRPVVVILPERDTENCVMLISIRNGVSFYFFYADRDIRSELIYARLILDLSSVQ